MKKTKIKWLMLLLVGFLLVGAGIAQATPIAITNASFEDPVLADDEIGAPAGWTKSPNATGIWHDAHNPPTTTMTGGNAAHGLNMFDVMVALGKEAGVSQALTSTVQEGTYTLTVAVGKFLASTGYEAADFSLGIATSDWTFLANYDGAASEVTTAGGFVEKSVQAVIGAGNVNIGETLMVYCYADNPTVDDASLVTVFDNVRLDFVAIPEPATLALLAIGGGFALWRKRR